MKPPALCWLVDFEFHQPAGELPRPLCMVARKFHSGETIRLWLWDEAPDRSPIPMSENALYVAYLASAELSCHLALGWALPVHVLDLFAEFSLATSGQKLPGGKGLLGALAYHGLLGIQTTEKEDLRGLAIRGGPFTPEEREALLDYCESDVVALAALLPKMWPTLDLPRALVRGRYMKAVALAERVGVPLAKSELALVQSRWDAIRRALVDKIDGDFGVYDGFAFRQKRFRNYCARRGIRWPQHESGSLCLDEETFKLMARIHPEIQPLHELRKTLGQLRLNELPVGADGRNRYLSGVFRSKTGRNQPSSSKSIFGPSRWVRHFIKPEKGMAVAYIDFSQQEFGIAAKLSGDRAMQQAYRSGDPYLEFAKLAGAVPADATKQSHPDERALYKVAALGILMGMGAAQLGFQTKTCEATGRRLLRQHKEVFARYWQWSDNQVDRAQLGEALSTTFGWKLLSVNEKSTTYRNFKLQANGADILRLSAIAIAERGIRLCAMIHDAVLIEAPIERIDDDVAEARRLMSAASRAVLGGFTIETDVEIVRFPDRFSDPKGSKLWETVSGLAGL